MLLLRVLVAKTGFLGILGELLATFIDSAQILFDCPLFFLLMSFNWTSRLMENFAFSLHHWLNLFLVVVFLHSIVILWLDVVTLSVPLAVCGGTFVGHWSVMELLDWSFVLGNHRGSRVAEMGDRLL